MQTKNSFLLVIAGNFQEFWYHYVLQKTSFNSLPSRREKVSIKTWRWYTRSNHNFQSKQINSRLSGHDLFLKMKPSCIIALLKLSLYDNTYVLNLKDTISQLAFICSKSKMETLQQCWNLFNGNNKETRTTSLTLLWCLCC